MTKVLSSKLRVSVYTQATLLPVAGALIALIAAPLLGGLQANFARISLLAVVLVVLGQGLGNMAYFAALKDLSNGTAQIAFSSILLFNTLLSLVFLRLHLSAVNIIGLVLLMMAILVAATGKVEMHKKGIAHMVLAAFLFSIFQLASASISKQVGPALYLVLAYTGAALVVLVARWKVVCSELVAHVDTAMFTVPLLTAIPSLGNFLFAYYAYRTAPQPAKVAMLLTSQVVLTVLLSYFFLKERGAVLRKTAAAIIVVLAAVLIKS